MSTIARNPKKMLSKQTGVDGKSRVKKQSAADGWHHDIGFEVQLIAISPFGQTLIVFQEQYVRLYFIDHESRSRIRRLDSLHCTVPMSELATN